VYHTAQASASGGRPLADAAALSYVGIHVARGSLIGLAAAGAASVVALVVGVVVALRGCGGGDAPHVAAPPDSAARVGAEGMGAKGTAELRAMGCVDAVVVDMQRLLGSASKVREGEPRYMVTCDVSSATGAPTCDKLAGTYFGAIGGTADANVCVRVTLAGVTQPSCSRLYAPNGTDLGPFPRAP
jgi:hypothetical protein